MYLDQLNGMLLLDNRSVERFQRCQPHLYALDVNQPETLSGFMRLPSQVVANINNWVNSDELQPL